MRLYNVSPSPEIVGGWNNLAVRPGEGQDFDEETAAQLLNTGRWSAEDPRAGLAAELAFKQRRDNTQTPAVPDNQGAAE
jgi:hypothetical protein